MNSGLPLLRSIYKVSLALFRNQYKYRKQNWREYQIPSTSKSNLIGNSLLAELLENIKQPLVLVSGYDIYLVVTQLCKPIETPPELICLDGVTYI